MNTDDLGRAASKRLRGESDATNRKADADRAIDLLCNPRDEAAERGVSLG
jgi:hypothetical protein